MEMYHVKHYERGWSEVLKITRAPNSMQSNLCYLELDGRQVGTVYAFEGWHDRIREALEEREATPEEGYLLEEQGREIATLVKRLANAELLIERLKREIKELDFSVALHDRNAALRTAEESSVVDRTPAKQPEVITKLGKAVQNIDVTKRVLVENSCPSEFGLEDCEFGPQSGCTLCCEDCWNGEVES
jgi:hypothetical protein